MAISGDFDLAIDSGRDRFAARLLTYFGEHPCIDCGESDPTTLDFDHRDGVEKLATVNALVRALNWAGLLAEIAKCDVRCANCHRRRTAAQRGWTSRMPRETNAA